jgi:hypothetical protein
MMPVSWDLTRCENHEQLQSDTEWPTTSRIIEMCGPLGMTSIRDDKDAVEFFLRCRYYEGLFGLIFPGPRPVSIEDVRKRIGLTTNHSPEKRAGRAKRMAECFFQDRINQLG